MRSSDGHYWIALDHVRAVAALMVFTWHFIHAGIGTPVPFGAAPAVVFPLALLDEGHIGVALFMTLSGYLFAKLLHGKDVLYGRFFWNRFIRLAPLLIVVMIAYGATEKMRVPTFNLAHYAHSMVGGVIKPRWPNGGWSITVEMHFYILLPVILLVTRKFRWTPLLLLGAAIAVRAILFLHYGQIQELAYFTIVGRFDQFMLGIVAFQFRDMVRDRHWLTLWLSIIAMGFYWWFDAAGGYVAFGGKFPSPSPLWIMLPTLEGMALGWAIAYYDASFSPSRRGISLAIGRIGTYSYSIYLLHTFIVFQLPLFINDRIMPISNFYVACAVSLVCFCGMSIIGWASYSFIEKPFLKLRVRYTRPAHPVRELATA